MNDTETITENKTEATETGSVEQVETNQVEEKMFRQDDVDRIVKARLAQAERKYEGVDIEEYQNLKKAQSDAEKAQMMKREQFEELLQKQKTEADDRIGSLQSELHKIKIDGAIMSAASTNKALNPTHVVELMKSNIRLGENGQPEVLDSEGQVRYNTDTAQPVTVDEAVAEFLTANAYFRAAAPAGAGSTGNATHSTSREVELNDLDMTNPEHRKIYKQRFAIGQQRSFVQK